MRNIAIVGGGKVGSVLGRLMVKGGGRIACVVSRTPGSAKRAAKFVKCKNASTSLESIPGNTDLIFVATPHGAIEDVARGLANLQSLNFKRLAVCHASGMLTADALEPVQRRGATVFSFHPLQTFPRDFDSEDIVDSARGIYYGVDGTRRALRKARELARMLKGKLIEIKPEMRVLYHAACVLASNHLTTMMWILESVYRVLQPKGNKPVFKPIIMATLNNIERTSPPEALSGPIARGGVETVAEHFKALRRYAPQFIPYFAMLSIETVKLAAVKGSITQDQGVALLELIQKQLRTNLQTQETH